MLIHESPPRIQILNQTLANQIAAGEVVERPASVIKELLENALDAAADRVQIEIEHGGNTLIRLSDNGYGIHPDDLPLVLERHSTSKISQLVDLDNLQSLGFRGEALASISSVSEFSILTAIEGQLAYKLSVNHNGKPEILPQARNRGTTIEVRNLFYNTPARRKFLRSEQTEYLHCLNTIKRQVLSRFDVHFQLSHNQRTVMTLPNSSDDYSQRIAQICGQSFLDNSLSIEFEHEGMRLWGWLGQTSYHRNQTDLQFFYLNGRFLRDKQVNHAIRLAYHEHIPPGRFPCFVLFFEMQGSDVDINVHPSKQEVRFAQIRQVHDFIFGCVDRGLHDKNFAEPEKKRQNSPSETATTLVQNVQINESVTEYNFKSKPEFACNNLIHERYLVITAGDTVALFDSYRARIEAAKALLTDKKSIKPLPLLMPRTITGREEAIEQFLQYQQLLESWGIVIRCVAPERIHISHLAREYEFTDFQSLFNDLVQSSPIMPEDKLKKLMFDHINDNVSEENVQDSVEALCADFIQSLPRENTIEQALSHSNCFKVLAKTELERWFKTP